MRSGVIRKCGVLVLSALLVAVLTIEAHAEPARLGLRLAPSSLKESLSLLQQLHVEREDRTNALQVALEIDADRIEMVGLAFGLRVLTLHYDGTNLKTWRHAMMPAEVRSEDILEDIQLTYWPVEVIRQVLPSGWSIEDGERERTLYLDDQPVMTIKYEGRPRWQGKVELVNLRYRYRLTIQSMVTSQ